MAEGSKKKRASTESRALSASGTSDAPVGQRSSDRSAPPDEDRPEGAKPTAEAPSPSSPPKDEEPSPTSPPKDEESSPTSPPKDEESSPTSPPKTAGERPDADRRTNSAGRSGPPSGYALLTVLSLVLALGLVALGTGVWHERARLSALDGRLTALDARLSALPLEKVSSLYDAVTQALLRLDGVTRDQNSQGERLDALDTAWGQRGQDLSEALERLDALDAASGLQGTELSQALERLDARDSALSDDLISEVAGLRADLESLRAAQQSEEVFHEALPLAMRTMALFILESKVMSGRSFSEDLALMRALEGEEVDWTPLAAFASSGLTSVARLSSEFSALSDEAIEAALYSEATTWLQRLRAWFLTSIRLRPLHPDESSSPAHRVARIEGLLAIGDLDSAVEEVVSLPPAAQEHLALWSARLREQHEAQRLLAQVRGRLGKRMP